MCCQSIAQPNKLSSPIVYLNLFVLILEEVNSHSAVRADFQNLYSVWFQTQTILSLLAEVDTLHIIASIDHINAPLS